MLAGGILLFVIGCYALTSGPVTVPQSLGPLVGVPRGGVAPSPAWVAPGIAFLWTFALVFGGLETIAMGALCMLMIHMEENMRATAQALDKIRSRLESSPEGVEPWFRT
jgi:hypothetical protein